jgi:hypothetical protein
MAHAGPLQAPSPRKRGTSVHTPHTRGRTAFLRQGTEVRFPVGLNTAWRLLHAREGPRARRSVISNFSRRWTGSGQSTGCTFVTCEPYVRQRAHTPVHPLTARPLHETAAVFTMALALLSIVAPPTGPWPSWTRSRLAPPPWLPLPCWRRCVPPRSVDKEMHPTRGTPRRRVHARPPRQDRWQRPRAPVHATRMPGLSRALVHTQTYCRARHPLACPQRSAPRVSRPCRPTARPLCAGASLRSSTDRW